MQDPTDIETLRANIETLKAKLRQLEEPKPQSPSELKEQRWLDAQNREAMRIIRRSEMDQGRAKPTVARLRYLVSLREVDGLSFRAMARELGVTAARAHQLYTKAKRKLGEDKPCT
jgi:DNA-directed RNA polymerase specialized sigma24 family protein